MSRSALIAILFAIVSVLTAPTATAHSALVSSDPGADSVLTGPQRAVALTFNQPIAPQFAVLKVSSSNGEELSTTTPLVAKNVVRVELVQPAPGGTYTVAYRVVSEDGHPITGSFAFSVEFSPTATTATGTAAPAPSNDSPSSDSRPDPAGRKTVPWLVGMAMLGVFVGGVISIVMRMYSKYKTKHPERQPFKWRRGSRSQR